jgi:hypothetical protein
VDRPQTDELYRGLNTKLKARELTGGAGDGGQLAGGVRTLRYCTVVGGPQEWVKQRKG